MRITKRNPFTKEFHTLDLPITHAQITAYEEGELVQVAFPNLTPTQREFIRIGLDPEYQAAMEAHAAEMEKRMQEQVERQDIEE